MMNNAFYFLQKQWQSLWQGDNYDVLFDTLVAHYTKSHRHYHNLTHLHECFIHFDNVKNKLQHPKVVALALFYHDVIYEPNSHTNEIDSANFAKTALMGKISQDDVDKICAYIVATQHHQNTLRFTDLDYLLDMDLAILGADKGRFDEYNTQIRQEYAWVDDTLYHTKRRQVLQRFYQQSPLFITPYFYNLLETQAKHNLGQVLGSNQMLHKP